MSRARVKIDPTKKRYTPRQNSAAGHPEFEPQDWQRRMVTQLAGIGLPQQRIAIIIETSLLTLRKYFAHELEMGVAQVQAIYLQTMFNRIKNGDARLLEFYCRTQMGWVEPKNVPAVDEELEGLSDDDLSAEIRAIEAREAQATKAREVVSRV